MLISLFFEDFGRNLFPLPKAVEYLLAGMGGTYKERIFALMKYMHILCEVFEMTYSEEEGISTIGFGMTSCKSANLEVAVMTNIRCGLMAIDDFNLDQLIVDDVYANTISFKSELIDKETYKSDAYLVPIMEQHLDLMTKALTYEKSFRAKVENTINDCLGKGEFGVDIIAKELGMSRQTLHRKLKEEGVNYSTLADRIRLDMAQAYLTKTDETMETIAFLLGFSEASAFLRFFQKNQWDNHQENLGSV